MQRKRQEILIIAGVVLCSAFVLLDSARWFLRADLSRGKAFTISPVSRALLARIPDQVHITYYVSDALRSVSAAPGRILDFLQEYAAQSGGKVTVTSLDPIGSGRAESARRFGILPQQVQLMQQNQQRTLDVFSGMVVEYLDRYTTLPAVFTSDGLEYSLGISIRKLVAGRRLAVGVIVGDRARTFAGDFEALQTGLSRDYSLREILPGERIPPETDVLIVAGGTLLSRAECAPIDSYLIAGGKVLFAVKGLRVDTRRTFRASTVRTSALLDMIETYGVRIGRHMVLDSACRDYRLPQQDASGRVVWETIAKYPPWVSIQAADVSQTDPITKSFTGLDLLWPSPLAAVPVAGVQASVLATSSASSWTMGEPFVIDPFNVPQQAGPSDPKNKLPLVYALTGRFPSAFGVGTGEPTRVIVVGDDDFLTDLMQFSDSLTNVFFVENAILWLSGNEDLLTLKTRAPTEGRLDRIEDPQARQSLMLFSEILNVAVIPAFVLLVGLLRALRRRRSG
jgi:gliding motility-associatede transport system auxiliary component